MILEADGGRLRQICRALGADEDFTKPVDRERLSAWLVRAAGPAVRNAA